MATTDFRLGAAGSEQLMSIGDASFDRAIENIAKETRLLGGKLVRYKQAQMYHWLWDYRYLPGKRTYVYDGGMGRDDLLALYVADAEMNFIVPQDNVAQITYVVRFALNSWKDRIVFRSGDFWAYSVSFELVQTQ